MHLRKLILLSDRFPAVDLHPFNLPVFLETREIEFHKPVSFFVGENGCGKTTLLEALANRCRYHIWRPNERTRHNPNPFEDLLFKFLQPVWEEDWIPGSFFAAEIFKNFARNLDEWAASDPGQLKYFGGKSLMVQSHGQSLMAYFRSRYKIRGLHLLDEPETALSPRTQLELLNLVNELAGKGESQFIIATHSPILMSCPEAEIYSFDHIPVRKLNYEDTDHFRVYRDFILERLGED